MSAPPPTILLGAIQRTESTTQVNYSHGKPQLRPDSRGEQKKRLDQLTARYFLAGGVGLRASRALRCCLRISESSEAHFETKVINRGHTIAPPAIRGRPAKKSAHKETPSVIDADIRFSSRRCRNPSSMNCLCLDNRSKHARFDVSS